jgi:hypothetical protein
VVTSDQRSAGVKGASNWSYRDERALASLSNASKPFGLLAGTTWGVERPPKAAFELVAAMYC